MYIWIQFLSILLIIIAFLSIFVTLIDTRFVLGSISADILYTFYWINFLAGLIATIGFFVSFWILDRLFERIPFNLPEIFLSYIIYLAYAFGFVLVKSVMIDNFFSEEIDRKKLIKFNFLASFVIITGLCLWYRILMPIWWHYH